VSNKSSLKYQFKKQLAISIGLLVIVFSFLLYNLFYIGIGTTMHRTMMSMASHYAKQVELNTHYQLPSGDEYSAYVGRKNIPSEIEALFDVDAVNNFEFAVNDGNQLVKFFRPEKVYFLLAYPIENNKDKLYLLYNESHNKKLAPPPKRGPLLNFPISVIVITLFAIALVYWVAQQLIGKVLNPLNELSQMAESLDENNPELSFDVMNDKTEIGVVANTLHQTMGRIHQYHQREKHFLQNASHELRTPMAVVSSALDIIDLRISQGNSNIGDQHTNIRRANKNMTLITEALLLLSRNDTYQAPLENIDLEQILAAIIDEHRYLLKGKDVEVELVTDNNSSYELPKSLCQIALSNLVRNAFEHTLSGIVYIQLESTTVSITNTNSGLENNYQKASKRGFSQNQGFGIGLDIVNQIVTQQNWQLKISSEHKNGNQVVISFQANLDSS